MALDPEQFDPNAFTYTQGPDGNWIVTPSPNGALGNVPSAFNYFADKDLLTPGTNTLTPQNYAALEDRGQTRNAGGDFMSLWGPLALIGLATGGILSGAFAGAGGAAAGEAAGGLFNAAGTGAAGGAGYGAGLESLGAAALPDSYWGMQAAAGNPVASSAYGGAAETAGAGGAAGGSSAPSWLTNYLSNVGSPQWLAQQGLSTGISSLLNGGGSDTGGLSGAGAGAYGNISPDVLNALQASDAHPAGFTSSGGGDSLGGTLGTANGSSGSGFNLTPSNYLSAAQLLSGLGGAFAANKAAGQQSDAATMAALLQQQNFERINAQQQPWIQSGVGALKSINEQLPYFNHQFNAADLNANLAPNWKFALDQGIGATKNAANLQTGVLSGNALKGIADYTLNKSGDLYQNAFNNYSQNQSNIYNRLSNLAGLGGQAAQTNAQAGTSAAQSAGNFGTQAGAAQAGGTVGMANNLAGGLTNAASWYTLPSILSSLKNGTT